MMSTRTNRKQQNQEENEQQSIEQTENENGASSTKTDIPEMKKAADQADKAEKEAEQESVVEKEEPEESKKPRRTRKRARPLAQAEAEEQIDLLSDEVRQAVQSGEREERLNIPDVLPVLPLKDTVVYPFAVQPLGVGQERSIRLIDDVMRGNRLVVLVAQKSAETEQAGPDEIFSIGTVARIARMIRMPDGTIQIIVQGLERVIIGEFTQTKPYLIAGVTVKPDVQEDDKETEAIKRNVVNYFQRLVALVQNVPEGVAA
ncbi:MAG TPA: LON peptidase substrate-binding domain-containing protein, partial [Ktedonobacteraceae bacterium]|nr:LON peptidase substrate-binding domain-containing protein [Ktedonobacteraceae bacterium]